MKRFIVFALVSSGLSVLFALVAARLWATPLACAAGVALALAVAAFFFGLSTGDYSWVDRIWSVAPVAFAWIYAAASGFSLGPSLSASLVSLWGARLTFNFARRGGYSGMEDYRWSVLRARITRPLSWQLFNALFICLFQIGVLFLISSPLARLGGGGKVSAAFIAALSMGLAFIAWETVADEEQWRFHARKAKARAALKSGGLPDPEAAADLMRGFCNRGLFRLSRHPNYCGELGFWWSVWLAGALGSGGRVIDWSIAGALALSAVFIGSTQFTEEISASKYPGYRAYQASTSPILPWFPSCCWGRIGHRGSSL